MRHQTHKQKYVQDYILRVIGNGMRCGDVLPTIKEFSEHLSVSQMTVSRAMEYLESVNVLKRIHGKGTFVGGHELLQERLPEYVQKPKTKGKPIITFLSPFYHSSPWMADYTRGVEAALNHQKYVLFNRHVYINKTHEDEELVDAADKSAGLILISSYPPAMQNVLYNLVSKNYPVVLLDRWPSRQLCHSVSLDNSDAVEQGMKELYRTRTPEHCLPWGKRFRLFLHRRQDCGLQPVYGNAAAWNRLFSGSRNISSNT